MRRAYRQHRVVGSPLLAGSDWPPGREMPADRPSTAPAWKNLGCRVFRSGTLSGMSGFGFLLERESHLDQLRRWARESRRAGRFVLISGEAGVGKSSLVRAFV